MTTYRYAVLIDADSPEEAAERIAEMIANEGIPADVLDVEQEAADHVEGWKVGDRFTWRYISSAGPRVVMHVGRTHLAYASKADPGDWSDAELAEIDGLVDRCPTPATEADVAAMLDAYEAEHGEPLARTLLDLPSYA